MSIVKLRFVCAVMAITLLLASFCSAETEEELLKSRTESYNKVVSIDGRNYVVFAQNSPEYADIYISKNYSATVGKSACAPFTLANILVNMVNYEELPLIRNVSKWPIRIDTHSILREQGIRERDSFEIKTKEDYFRYFPLCIINIVASNNKGLGSRYATAGYYKVFFKNFGLTYETTMDIDYCVEKARQPGVMIAVSTGGRDSPIAKINGHYFVFAHADDEYAYFLDSSFRNEYKDDYKKIIHVIEPGLFSVRLEDLRDLQLSGTKYIVTENANRTLYSQDIFQHFGAVYTATNLP